MKYMSSKFTYNVSFRYSDERDYRPYACGISSISRLGDIVSDIAILAGVEDIRIAIDLCETDFKQFTI